MVEFIEGLIACASLIGIYWLIVRSGRPADGHRRPRDHERWPT